MGPGFTMTSYDFAVDQATALARAATDLQMALGNRPLEGAGGLGDGPAEVIAAVAESWVRGGDCVEDVAEWARGLRPGEPKAWALIGAARGLLPNSTPADVDLNQ